MNKPARILVVDDDPILRSLIVDILLTEGYEVAEASGGWEAICALGRVQPHLILLDIVMADMDGLEACRVIKHKTEKFRHVRVILMSASHVSKETKRTLCNGVGADDYLCKPDEMPRLRSCVQSLLACA